MTRVYGIGVLRRREGNRQPYSLLVTFIFNRREAETIARDIARVFREQVFIYDLMLPRPVIGWAE